MGVKHWVRAMLVLSALPAAAAALGLGEIRLKSPLNAPLDAEIELVNAAPEELAGLKAQLASRETFARYGLEWPSFLGSITLVRGKSANGADVLRLRSAEPITEPFVTLLVDADWGRGRLVREYTLLLDPPTYTPEANPPVPVAAAATPAPRVPEQPAPVAVPAPGGAGEPGRAPAARGAADTVTVRRGDTLSGVAARALGDSSVSLEQAMVSLYRSNPRAFGATMNDLRAGAVLRVPDVQEMTAISRQAAIAEVGRQGSEWRNRGGAVAAAEGAGRLRLVPPEETAAAAAGTGGGGDAQIGELQERLGALEKELADSRRLLELRAQQIAELQARLSAAAQGAAPVVPAEAPVPGAGPEVAPEAPAAAPPAPAATAVPAAPVAKPVPRPSPPAVVAEEPPAPSLLDTVFGVLGQFWWAIAGLIGIVAGLFGFKAWQRKREAELVEATDVVLPPPPDLDAAVQQDLDATVATATLRRPNISAPQESTGFVVEESGEYARPDVAASAEPVAPVVSADETLSVDTNLNLDQGDPLAEADFHMAYGLYDQAADLVKLAIGREPLRRDLRLKLAEVYFVWGNRDEFLRTARELHETRSTGMAGEWEKIVIMGRQIAADDPLFESEAGRTGSSGALDMPLDEGTHTLDFDLAGDSTAANRMLDIAVGDEPRARPDSPTEVFDAAALARGGAALRFDDGLTSESPVMDLDLSDDLSEAATVQSPMLPAGTASAPAATIREKLDAALRPAEGSIEQTAELAIEDLGLDLGDLTGLQGVDDAKGAGATGRFAAGALADIESTARRNVAGDAPVSLDAAANDFIDIGEDIAEVVDLGAARRAASGSPAPAGSAAPRADDDTHIELSADLIQLDAPADEPAFGSEVDVGELSMGAAEPATLSEVGTKLDLARAYIDMGDPEGARSILQEVLQEGSLSQKQEAQRLVEALPG